MDPGGIVGIVIAVLVVIAALILLYFFFQKRKKGDFLISEKTSCSPQVSYSNQGYVGDVEKVNVLDFSEVPFTAAEVRPNAETLRRPALKRPVSVAVNGGHFHIMEEDDEYATIKARESTILGDPSREDAGRFTSAGAEDKEDEGVVDLDGDYATLDSVAKKNTSRWASAEEGVEPGAKHVTVVQLQQQDVTHVQQIDQRDAADVECEYATVVPKSLRGNKDIPAGSVMFDMDLIDHSAETLQPMPGVIPATRHQPYLGNELSDDDSLEILKSSTGNQESNVFDPNIGKISTF